MSNDFDDTTPDESPRQPISRRSTLDYFNPSNAGHSLRRWLGTREKVVEGLKTFGWVVPLTILIWIYAERQQLVQNPVVLNGVEIAIHSDDPLKTAHFNGQEKPTVTLKLMGPQEGVRKVVDQLTRIPHEALILNVGSNQPAGNSQINVTDRLQPMDLFKNNGVSIQEVQPPDLSVNIDSLDHRLVPVQVPPGHPDWSATVDPQKVSVSGPRGLLDQLEAQRNLKVYLRLDGYSQLKTSGTYPLKGVSVDSPVAARVSIDPNHVDATVQVAESDENFTLVDPVQIYILQGPDVYDYSFHPTETSIDAVVEVKGPKDQIDLLKNKTWVPRAIIHPTLDDVEKFHRQELPPTFDLPPGVTVVNKDAFKPVKITYTKQ
jgi:hypothetical protein